MSAQTDFFTIGAQEKLSIFSVTSEVAGHEIEMAFDHSLNSYWKPTGNATQNIILDLGENKSINGLGIFLRNHNTDVDGGATGIQFWHGTSTSGPWTLLSTITPATAQTIGDPIMLSTSVAAQSKRYWKISVLLQDPAALLEVSHFFLYRKRTITSLSVFPEPDSISFPGRAQNSYGGRVAFAPYSSRAIELLTRRWQIVGDTDKNTLDSVFADCAGRMLPLIIQEDSGTPRVVEIINVRNNHSKQRHQTYNPLWTFRTLPYLTEGEAY